MFLLPNTLVTTIFSVEAPLFSQHLNLKFMAFYYIGLLWIPTPLKAQKTSGSLDTLFKLSEKDHDQHWAMPGFITFLEVRLYLGSLAAILGGIRNGPKELYLRQPLFLRLSHNAYLGIWGNYPVMLAQGMSMNGFFKGLLLSGSVAVLEWSVTFGIFLSNILYLAFSLTNIRKSMIESIPEDLKLALLFLSVLFIAFLGLRMPALSF